MAPGSRLSSEVAPIAGGAVDEGAHHPMEAVTRRWRDNGFDVELGDLGYPGPRHDVADHLDARGWRSVRTPLRELFAATGLSQPPRADGAMPLGDNYYCASVRI
jgi:O-methyltransferase involved in polyketide biosynthesis